MRRPWNSDAGSPLRPYINKGAAMASELKSGDKVEWNTAQGTTTGVVVRKQTTPTKIKSHTVAASPDHPEFIVRSDKSGKEAAHVRDALRRRT